MHRDIFIGVDGGATKSIVRIEDVEGHLLGQALSGPASVRISPELAWHSINAALNKLLNELKLPTDCNLHMGMGLAGCEIVEAYQAFINKKHPFKTLIVSSDSHVACLGAHKGHDGAIVIAGTGVVGYQISQGLSQQVGGWGFPHDDEGGGAWLGLNAMRLTFKWLDGRTHASGLTEAIFAYFEKDQNRMITWANQANATVFAEIAPIVVQQSQQGDKMANDLLKSSARAIEQIAEALHRLQQDKHTPLPCSILGGVSSFIEPYLGDTLCARLHPAKDTPVAGALLLVRKTMERRLNL